MTRLISENVFSRLFPFHLAPACHSSVSKSVTGGRKCVLPVRRLWIVTRTQTEAERVPFPPISPILGCICILLWSGVSILFIWRWAGANNESLQTPSLKLGPVAPGTSSTNLRARHPQLRLQMRPQPDYHLSAVLEDLSRWSSEPTHVLSLTQWHCDLNVHCLSH